MDQPVSENFKSVQILKKASEKRSERIRSFGDKPQGCDLFDAPESVKTASSDVIEADVRIVHDHEPVLRSTLDPSKRRPNYKEPTPDSEWRPEWKPRKRQPGLTRGDREVLSAVATEVLVGAPDLPDRLPTDPRTGRVVKSPELLEALCNYMAQGGMMLTFSQHVGMSRSTLYSWCSKDPEWKAAVAKAKEQGVDAIAEEALTIATETLMVEDVYERYDKNGKLLSMDKKKGDAVHARKLAVSTRLELLKKWAPEKYGDKVEAKSDSSLASKILAARKRVG